ncbi:putative carbonic anhydrase [Helianthus anomalus]
MHRIMDNESFLFFALFLIFCDEQEFSYDVNSPNGPNHWGELNPKWSTCNNGDM